MECVAQLSVKIIWTHELSKVYGWVSSQKDPWHNQNSLKTKKFNHGLQSYQLISAGQLALVGRSAGAG